jgi:hypothetical protein
MGLDQYAYVIDNNGKKEELAYWRKHPNLQGFMETLWRERGCPNPKNLENSLGLSNFNGIPLSLTEADLDRLEAAITNAALPATTGFFFGEDSDAHYKEQDLEFVKKSREALSAGLNVFYDSWW